MNFFEQKKAKKNMTTGGFTLVEVIVAVGLFVAVFIAISASFISIVGGYKKVMAERTNVDNLGTAIESMVRGIKTGTTYHCGSGGVINAPQSCPNGGTYLAFEKAQGDVTRLDDQIVYRFHGGVLQRSNDGGSNFYPLTENTSMLRVTDIRFYVRGTTPFSPPDTFDTNPPRVNIVIKGISGLDASRGSSFSVQTTIVQRLPDVN